WWQNLATRAHSFATTGRCCLRLEFAQWGRCNRRVKLRDLWRRGSCLSLALMLRSRCFCTSDKAHFHCHTVEDHEASEHSHATHNDLRTWCDVDVFLDGQ